MTERLEETEGLKEEDVIAELRDEEVFDRTPSTRSRSSIEKAKLLRRESKRALLTQPIHPIINLTMRPAFPDEVPLKLQRKFFDGENLTSLSVGSILHALLPEKYFYAKREGLFPWYQAKKEYLKIIEPSAAQGVNNEKIFIVQLQGKALTYVREKASALVSTPTIPNETDSRSALHGWRKAFHKSPSLKLAKDPNVFIVKQVSKETGQKDLAALNIVQERLPSILSRNRNPNLPTLAYAESYFSYQAPRGNQHIVSVIHGAKGLPLEKNIQFLLDSGDLDSLNRMLENVGSSFGALHFALAPNKEDPRLTIIHGDLNVTNVFYSLQDQKTTIIDNASFALALYAEIDHPEDNVFTRDIATFLYGQMGTGALIESELSIESMTAFFSGYLHSFPEAVRPLIRKALISKLQPNEIRALSAVEI